MRRSNFADLEYSNWARTVSPFRHLEDTKIACFPVEVDIHPEPWNSERGCPLFGASARDCGQQDLVGLVAVCSRVDCELEYLTEKLKWEFPDSRGDFEFSLRLIETKATS